MWKSWCVDTFCTQLSSHTFLSDTHSHTYSYPNTHTHSHSHRLTHTRTQRCTKKKRSRNTLLGVFGCQKGRSQGGKFPHGQISHFHTSVHLSVHPSIFLSVRLSVCLSVRLCVHLSVSLSVCLHCGWSSEDHHECLSAAGAATAAAAVVHWESCRNQLSVRPLATPTRL